MMSANIRRRKGRSKSKGTDRVVQSQEMHARAESKLGQVGQHEAMVCLDQLADDSNDDKDPVQEGPSQQR